MKLGYTIAVAIASAYLIGGCTYYADAPVYGRRSLVSSEDLRAATVAVTKASTVEKIYAYRVANRDEIWIYISPDAPAGSYWITRRVGDHWEHRGGTLVMGSVRR